MDSCSICYCLINHPQNLLLKSIICYYLSRFCGLTRLSWAIFPWDQTSAEALVIWSILWAVCPRWPIHMPGIWCWLSGGSSARDVHWSAYTPGEWISYSMAAGSQEREYQQQMFQETQEEVARLLWPSLRCHTVSLLPYSIGEVSQGALPNSIRPVLTTRKDIVRKV